MLITRLRDNFRMFRTPCKVSADRTLRPISAKPRKPIVSSVTAVPANFWNDTCTRIRDTWLTCTGQANYWETIHALNVLTYFPIWILLRYGGRKSSFGHVGLPSDEQTRAIKQRESFSDTSMTMMHCTLECFSVGTRWARRELLPSFTPLKLRAIERSIFFNCHASCFKFALLRKIQLNYTKTRLSCHMTVPVSRNNFKINVTYTYASTLHFTIVCIVLKLFLKNYRR